MREFRYHKGDTKVEESTAEQISTEQPSSTFKCICIIGLGLIGASIAAALKRAYPDVRIFGVDTDSRTRVVALERGWVDEVSGPEDESFAHFITDAADLVIIATPVACVEEYLEKLAALGYQGVVTDTVSTKTHIIEAAERILPSPQNYIPGHPMSGSENNGIDGARSDLFEGSNWILCPDAQTVPEHYQALHELICGLSARVVSIKREDHDKTVAIVSHVPHLVASALVNLANNHADESKSIMRLAAGGFKDTTRIAAGSPKLWCGIAFDNADALLSGLEEMTSILNSFATAIREEDRASFTDLLGQAAKTRRALPSAWIPSSERLLEVRIPMVNKTGVVAEVTTIASSVGCNIQSIEIDHLSEGNAVLSLMLTDEGDVGQLSFKLINAGYSVSFSPIEPKEHAHVQ